MTDQRGVSRKLRVFLCHSSEDKAPVRQLFTQLRTAHVDPWLDEESLLPGQNWEDEIRTAVRESDAVLVCLSHSSITKEGYVQKEIKFALDVAEEKPEGTIFLIPVRLEDCETPSRLASRHWVDLFLPLGLQRLVESLRARAGSLNTGSESKVEFPISPSPDAQPVDSAKSPRIAYFTMEMALTSDIPTYCGNLGIVAGDTVLASSDMGVPMVAISLVYRGGYFRQRIDDSGNQTAVRENWEPRDYLQRMEARVAITIQGRSVELYAWRYLLSGINGHIMPVFFLDTNVPVNSEEDRLITDRLYVEERDLRLRQEMVLGIGGVQLLEKLGYSGIETYHLNDGHTGLVALELLNRVLQESGRQLPIARDIMMTRRRCVLTLHSSTAISEESFPKDIVRKLLGEERTTLLFSMGISSSDSVNMINLSLHLANYVNAVSKKLVESCRHRFPNYRFRVLTNGVHAATWVSPPMRELFDREIPEWRHDNMHLQYATDIELRDLQAAHVRAKRSLLSAVRQATGQLLDEKAFTIGFAKRFSAGCRAELVLSIFGRLQEISRRYGLVQLICSGKAHPKDDAGSEQIRQLFQAVQSVEESRYANVVFIENYDLSWGGLLTGGVDLWLNTSRGTGQSSGISGMKAALNGVPSVSTLDGWWVEGHLEGTTGWSIDERSSDEQEAESLYGKLVDVILPLFYEDPDGYARIMRSTIARNGPLFTAQRMVLQYIFNAYSITRQPLS